MSKPNINIPTEFAINGDKTDFPQAKITNGFDRLQPDVLAGDNLNKFIDDTYKGLNGVLDLYKGAVLYDVNETYTNKSIIFNIDENNEIKIYRSLANNNIGNDLDDTDYWKEVSLGGGGSGHDLFDLVQKDHLLTYEETEGFALLGSNVYKEPVADARYGYPDFYEMCLAEKNAGTPTNTTLGDAEITLYVNANGHIYYDIADKYIIDNWYAVYGSAWYYGIDTVNEFVALPRKTKRYLVERQKPAGETKKWFNVYSDGWIEQGGYTESARLNDDPILLLKPYTSTDYTLVKAGQNGSSGVYAAQQDVYAFKNVTTTGFNMYTTHPTWWYAFGYGEVPDNLSEYEYMVVGNTAKVQTTTVSLSATSAVAPINFNTQTGAVQLSMGEGLKLDNDGNLAVNAENISSLGMPSGQLTALTLGASGESYLAPAAGYFYISRQGASNGQYITMQVRSAPYAPITIIGVKAPAATNNLFNEAFIPIDKGQYCTVTYTGNATNTIFFFVYAKGAQ